MLGDMHRIALLAALCSVPVLAADDTVRRGGIPKPYWGTWAPDASGCKEPAQRIFLSGEDYVGPEASCRVVSVSETPSQTGPNYSARLECSPKGVTNLIIQPKGKDAVLSGHDLQSLKPYQRCSTNAAAATEPGQSPKLSILPSPPAQAQRPDQTMEARIAEWFKHVHGRLGPGHAYDQGGVADNLPTCGRRAGTLRGRAAVPGQPS